MQNTSASALFKPIGKLFKRFHLTLFFVFIVACLGAGVILINQMLTGTNTADDYTSPISTGTIDQATLQRIQSLHTSNEPTPAQAYEGRINPFGE